MQKDIDAILILIIRLIIHKNCNVTCMQEESVEYVKRNMWYPVYSPLVHEK